MELLECLAAGLADRYIVERKIGEGGMATVFLARDIKHQRRVALKVLKPELGAMLGVERFLTEIRVTANLQHPNLLPLFDSGEVDGMLFYVMPFVAGESLRARLDRERELPVDEAIAIAIAIAGALDNAHRQQVLHRDLKPENILLNDGQPVVADFGIALAVRNAGGDRATYTGLALGTPQYMSPEQAAGDRLLDQRSDIYALAATLYEMLAGEPPHAGSSVTATMAKLLTETPVPLRVRREQVPAHVEWAVAKALSKRPADRFATAANFAKALASPIGYDTALRSGDTSTGVLSPLRLSRPQQRRAMARRAFPWVLAITAGIIAATIAGRREPASSGGVRAPVRFTVNLPDGVNHGATTAVLPDGSGVVFLSAGPGLPRLMRRMFDTDSVTPIPGTESTTHFAVSPNGERVALVQQASVRLIPIRGGTAELLLGANAAGLAWIDDERLVLGSGSDRNAESAMLRMLDVRSRKVTSLVDPAAQPRELRFHANPVVVDSGRYVLFAASSSGVNGSTTSGVVPIGGGAVRYLTARSLRPLGYAAGSFIFHAPTRQIMAEPLDLPSGREGVASTVRGRTWNPVLTAAGALTFAERAPFGLLYSNDTLGRTVVLDTITNATILWSLDLSPDGTRLLFPINRDTLYTTWVYDIPSRRLARASASRGDFHAFWLPDSKHFVHTGDRRLVISDADRPTDRRLLGDSASGWSSGATPDGRELLYHRDSTIMMMSASDGRVHDLPGGPLVGRSGRLSPDGTLLAFVSDESGVPQVFVRTVADVGSRVLVSTAGATAPAWTRDNRVVFAVERTFMSARIRTTPRLSADPAVPLPRLLEPNDGWSAGHYALRPDGAGAYFLRLETDQRQIGVVLNWTGSVVRLGSP